MKLFSAEECSKIIALKEKFAPNYGTTGDKNRSHNRRSEIRWINWSDEVNWIFDRIAYALMSANSNHWGFHLAGIHENLQLTHYKAEDLGHYDWHEDHGCNDNYQHRKISIKIPLSDDHEGGDFEILHHGKVMEATKGSIILFPSYLTHRVTPVTQGERWSLVAWISGLPFV